MVRGISSPGYQPIPRSLALAERTSVCLTSVQVYGYRRHQDPWRRENGQGKGGIVMADGDEADSRQGSEHHGESGAVEPGPAPVPLGG